MELARTVAELIELMEARRSADRDVGIAARLVAARADVAALKSMIYLVIARDREPGRPNSEGSMVRLYLSELAQRISGIAMDILGPSGLERDADGGWPRRYLIDLKHTIAGGTSEIQRNIIGERVLGLPKGK